MNPARRDVGEIRELLNHLDSMAAVAEHLGISPQRVWQKLNPEKFNAHQAVQDALRHGRLVRPEYCEDCGGKGPIEGHHEDYSKPLDVQWLCTGCHRDRGSTYRPFVQPSLDRRANPTEHTARVVASFDGDADVLTLEIVPGGGEGGKTVQVSEDLTIELDERGKPLELVLERASTYYPRQELEVMDTPALELSLADAAKEAGTLPSTLRNQINLGRLRGIKRGRDWVVSSTDLANYLANKDPRGRKPGAAKKRKRR